MRSLHASTSGNALEASSTQNRRRWRRLERAIEPCPSHADDRRNADLRGGGRRGKNPPRLARARARRERGDDAHAERTAAEDEERGAPAPRRFCGVELAPLIAAADLSGACLV